MPPIRLPRRIATGAVAVAIGCLAPGTADAQGVAVRICNRGSIPVDVATARFTGILTGYKVTGWKTVNPSSWVCFIHASGGSTAELFFAFKITDADGQVGITGYRPRKNRSQSKASNYAFCVPRSGSFQRIAGFYSFGDACSGSDVRVPFNWVVTGAGYMTEDDDDIELEIKPSKSDRLVMVLNEPARDATPWPQAPRTVPAPTPAPVPPPPPTVVPQPTAPPLATPSSGLIVCNYSGSDTRYSLAWREGTDSLHASPWIAIKNQSCLVAPGDVPNAATIYGRDVRWPPGATAVDVLGICRIGFTVVLDKVVCVTGNRTTYLSVLPGGRSTMWTWHLSPEPVVRSNPIPPASK